jgi:hypothetical protein
MKNLARFTLMIGAAALFASCGGSQPPTGASGATPQSRATQTVRGRSYEAKPDLPWGNVSLLYVAGGPSNIVYQVIVAGARGRLPRLVKVTGLIDPTGECPNGHGTAMWITTASGELYEFEHGGKHPIASLSGGNLGCSVDYRTTGNLAATDGNVLSVWQDAQGTPMTFSFPENVTLRYCGYDWSGDLFVDGYSNSGYGNLVFAELPYGSSTFEEISVDADIGLPGQVEFDGDYITIQDLQSPFDIYELAISGSTATVVKTFQPRFRKRQPNFVAASWIYVHNVPISVFIPYGSGHEGATKVSEWSYPGGTYPSTNFDFSNSGDFQAVAFSV